MKSGCVDLSKFSERELETKLAKLKDAGDYKEGISLGFEVLRKFPMNWILWNYVGCCFTNLDRGYEALVCDKKDIQFCPAGRHKCTALSNYGASWKELDVLSVAEKYFRKSLEENPSHYFVLGNLGKILLRLGKLEESKKISKQLESCALDPWEQSNYYSLKGHLALIEGRNEEAEKFYDSSRRFTETQYEKDSIDRVIEEFKQWCKKEKIMKQYFALEGLSNEERMKKVEELWDNVKTQKEVHFFDSIDFEEIKLERKLGKVNLSIWNLNQRMNEIGEGSFGIVHLGEWKSEKVAVKIIDFGKIKRPEYVLSEIALMSSFNHKRIMPLIGSGLNRINRGNNLIQEIFLVMPHMKGSLKSILFSLSLKRIVRICFDICCGMEYLHRIGIIHRNLKPENCLIADEDHIILCDFGLLRIDNGTTLKTYTGSLEYMAPEILFGKKIECDKVIDVYSFGVILWEMLSKKKAQPMKKSLLDFLWGESPTTLPLEECDKRFHSILKKTIIEDPTKRTTFGDILELLVDILDEIGIC